MSAAPPVRVPLDWRGRRIEIEVQWIEGPPQAPLMIFLHEGLGSVSMWRDYPRQLCSELGFRGLLYSRPGYGHSTPRPADEAWTPDFMHRQAHELLPTLLLALGIDTRIDRPWLFGHSDGASIALLHAARCPDRVAGLVVLAPHLFVEALSVDSIRKARETYLATDLRARLARHHRDPDSAFWGWNDIWLHPDFRTWNIERELGPIRCPVLAVQGRDDEYGTLAQIEHIATVVPQTRLCVLHACGHSPPRDQPAALTAAVRGFIQGS